MQRMLVDGVDILGAGPLSGLEGNAEELQGSCRERKKLSRHDRLRALFASLCCWSVVGGALPGYPWRCVIDDSAAFHHFNVRFTGTYPGTVIESNKVEMIYQGRGIVLGRLKYQSEYLMYNQTIQVDTAQVSSETNSWFAQVPHIQVAVLCYLGTENV